MGRGGGGDFAEEEARAARAFAGMARTEGIGRVIYLGGLGDQPTSKHLRSRHETARILAAEGPPLTYFRAAMVVGAGSESYRTLRYLVQRLPVMIAPSWLRTPTQPIGIDDVVSYLTQAPEVDGQRCARECKSAVPTSSPMERCSIAWHGSTGKEPRPKLSVPLLSPWLSSLWLGLITPSRHRCGTPARRRTADEDRRHRSVRFGAVLGRSTFVRRDIVQGARGEQRGNLNSNVAKCVTSELAYIVEAKIIGTFDRPPGRRLVRAACRDRP